MGSTFRYCEFYHFSVSFVTFAKTLGLKPPRLLKAPVMARHLLAKLGSFKLPLGWMVIWLKMCHNFVQFAFWQTIDCIVPEKLLCALWKANQNNPNKRGVEVCSCHCGQVGAGGGVGTKILACGAPRAFPGCHFLGQNYTPGQTGNPPGAVPQTSVVCSHNSLHVAPVCLFVEPLFVCKAPVCLFVEALFVCWALVCLSNPYLFVCRAPFCLSSKMYLSK